MSSTVATKTDVGYGSVAGLAVTPFAILFSFWIPTIALILAVAIIVGGALDLRRSTGRRRRVALLTIGLGLVPFAVFAIIVVLSIEPSSGTAVSSVPAPE